MEEFKQSLNFNIEYSDPEVEEKINYSIIYNVESEMWEVIIINKKDYMFETKELYFALFMFYFKLTNFIPHIPPEDGIELGIHIDMSINNIFLSTVYFSTVTRDKYLDYIKDLCSKVGENY